MTTPATSLEIESFNLADMDVSAMDVRLELTSVVPSIIICDGNWCSSHGGGCSTNGNHCAADCGTNKCTSDSGCQVDG